MDRQTLDQMFKEEMAKVEIKQVEDQRRAKKGQTLRKIKTNIIDGHYFLEERTDITYSFVIHKYLYKEEIPIEWRNKIYVEKENRWRIDNRPSRFLMSGQLISMMKAIDRVHDRLNEEHTCFKPLTWNEYSIMKTIYYDDIPDDDFELKYNPEFCTRKMVRSFKKEKKDNVSYWYADFESDVSGEIHKPFMVCVQKSSGTVKKCFKGENCGKELLEFLPDGSITYFHNLAYDIRMFAKVGKMTRMLQKGTKVMNTEMEYKDKKLIFRDTLPILNCKLSALPSMFDLKDIKKEIFPYKYYTLERLRENVGVISQCGEEEDKKWDEKDMKLFNENIDAIGCRLGNNEFDMYKYAEFYCMQDVNILRQGFNKFCHDFLKEFRINPMDYVSISSLANEVFRQNVYLPNGNLYEYSGNVQKFIQKAVHGGRCMCAFNKKWKLNNVLTDYDAVSLYPSAMARLYTVEGVPQVFDAFENKIFNEIPDFLNDKSAYVVKIEIVKVNKHYAFPLIVQKINGLNVNDDNITEPVFMYVDNIYLEDLVKFQKIEFRLIKGYYWTGKRDYRIQEEIKKLFNKRLEYKKQGNSLQQLYKLIMNSCYGKTIQKPVSSGMKFKHGDEIDKYVSKNYEYIKEEIEISDDSHMFKVMKPLDHQFSNTLLGVQILSMSKRIMNEVMCLAYDLKCHIYYQDTDSFMIELSDLEKLENEYEKVYGRKLRGTDLGNFHPDFESINGEVPVSIESIFLMKKMYVHKLQNSKGDIAYHIRGKGLTQQSIKNKCYDEMRIYDPMSLYNRLYNGESVIFDLAEGQPCFKFNKNLTVETLSEFKRKIKVSYDKGIYPF